METEHSAYVDWIETLDDDEFDNERYTVTHEAHLIGMCDAEAREKSLALETEATRRLVARLV